MESCKWYNVDFDGHRVNASFVVKARNEIEAEQKGRILYGYHDLLYRIDVSEIRDAKGTFVDEFEKFFKENQISVNDIISFF